MVSFKTTHGLSPININYRYKRVFNSLLWDQTATFKVEVHRWMCEVNDLKDTAILPGNFGWGVLFACFMFIYCIKFPIRPRYIRFSTIKALRFIFQFFVIFRLKLTLRIVTPRWVCSKNYYRWRTPKLKFTNVPVARLCCVAIGNNLKPSDIQG